MSEYFLTRPNILLDHTLSAEIAAGFSLAVLASVYRKVSVYSECLWDKQCLVGPTCDVEFCSRVYKTITTESSEWYRNKSG